MPDFDFVKYEPQDDGTIVRIILNRPEARNATEPGHARRAQRGVLGRRGGRQRPRRHPQR